MNDFSKAGNGFDDDRETAPENSQAGSPPAEFRATWAWAKNGGRISKVQTPSGKWEMASGVRSAAFFFKVQTYSSLEKFSRHYTKMLKGGRFALVAGEPRFGLNPDNPRQRVKQNFVDAASTRLPVDFDGLEPADPATPIDSAHAYEGDAGAGDAILVALERLPEAFRLAKCMPSTTSSTGQTTISTGAPSEGKARFRATWELSRPLTCGQKKILAKALKARPGLACVDDGLYSLEHFEFVARPVFMAGETDPIAEPVYLLEGGLLDVDAVCAELEIDLEAESPRTGRSAGQGGPWTGEPGVALDLPPEKAERLLRALLRAIRNEIGLRDGYSEWFGVIAAIFNASRGTDWGLEIAVEWTASGDYDTAEVYDKWDNLAASNDGRNGIDYLIRLAMALAKEKKADTDDTAKAEAAALEEAVGAINRACAAASFPDDDPLGAPNDDKPGDDEPDGPDEMDEDLLAQKMPAIDPKAFYGPLAEIIEAATRNSEATKIGVALQTIAHTALCLRPFCIPLGDGPICLNLFLLQIGLSSVGRKGTSSAFADNYVGPAIRALAGELQRRVDNADFDRADREAAREAVFKAERAVNRARDLTEADAAEAADEIAKLKAEKAETENAIVGWKNKLAAKLYAFATQRNYEKAIQQREARIAELEPLIRDAEAEHVAVAAALANRSAAFNAAEAALSRAKTAAAALPEPQAAPEPWDELFMALESPPAVMRGVSSGEGVIHEIRDARPPNGTRDDKGDPGVHEKRLLINLSEFGVVLAQIKRTGSTLSTTLRDAYDCTPLTTGSKNSPSRVEQPYINLSASITPAEFMQLTFDDRESTSADNGLTGRLLTVYVAREKLVALPLPTEGREALTRGLAENILKVYRELKPTEPFRHKPLEFTPEAEALYDKGGVYKRIATLSGASGNAGKLLTRIAPNLRKIAAVLAVMNGESRVSVGALEAAVAWIDYAEASANTIAATIKERRNHAKMKEDAAAVLAALKALGGDAKPVASREAQRKTGLDKRRFQAAVVSLVRRPPAPIEILEQEWVSGTGAVRKRSSLRLTRPPESVVPPTRQGGEAPQREADEVV